MQTFLGRSFPYRVRALTGLVDGEIKGIGGLAYLPDGTAMVFLHLAEGAERYAVTLHRAALKVIAMAQLTGIRVIAAQADEAYPTAERWLTRLGFEPVAVEGQRVFIWRDSP